jgi:hypothetical protein
MTPGMPTLHRQSHPVPLGLQAHHFRQLISLNVSIAISLSATMRLSLAYSVFSSRNRFTTVGSSFPNRRRQTQIVRSPILCLLGDFRGGVLIGLAQDRSHLLFGKSDFFHQLLTSSAGAIVTSQKWLENPGRS